MLTRTTKWYVTRVLAAGVAASLLAVVVATPALADAHGGGGEAPAAPVEVVQPNGLAVDRDGNLFISDIGTHRILKFDRDERLTVIAGTGEAGFGGDDGPASAAQLAAPSDLAFDAEGNLFVADTFNHRVRRIDAAGVITTVVGNGKTDYPQGDVAPREASLNNPQGVALDRGGNLFIADTYNHVVRRLDRARGVVTTFAGTAAGLAGDGGPAGKAQLNLPQAVAVAPDGSLYVSDSANSRIRRVRPDGAIETVAGSGPGSGEGGAGFAGDGGPAGQAKLFSAADLEFNALGQLYVSDSGNNRIRLIAHGVIATIAGSGIPGTGGEADGARATEVALNTPQKIAMAGDGSVFVADRANRRVLRVDPQGVAQVVIGGARGPASGDGKAGNAFIQTGPATESVFNKRSARSHHRGMGASPMLFRNAWARRPCHDGGHDRGFPDGS